MANFPVIPHSFLPGPVHIEAGPDDRPQRHIMVVGDPPTSHENFAIITLSREILEHERVTVKNEVRHILTEDFGLTVTYNSTYPLGAGLFGFSSSIVRDDLIDMGPYPYDDDHTFSAIRHDEGLNMRIPVFEAEAWIVLLAFPLDYQTDYYVNKAVSSFGRLSLWQSPGSNYARVLVRVLVTSFRDVPYSIVVKRANPYGGLGR